MLNEKSFEYTHTRKLKIRRKSVELKGGLINHKRISYWQENPRMGQFIDENNGLFDIEMMEEALIADEDIDTLAKEIEADGQINEPLIVSGKDLYVLEGNRRLAACRKLYKDSNNNEQWLKIKVEIVPKDIQLEIILQWLGDMHLIGKKQWSPYNKARFIYRKIDWNKDLGSQFDAIKEEYKFSSSADVKKSAYTIKLMKEHNVVDTEMYSQCELIYTNKTIREFTDKDPKNKQQLIKGIKKKKLGISTDFRKHMPKIIKSGSKSLTKKLLNDDIDFDVAVDKAKNMGAGKSEFTTISNFKEFIDDYGKVKKAITGFKGETFNKTLSNLKRISKNTRDMYDAMNSSKKS